MSELSAEERLKAFQSIVGITEDLPVTAKHDIYPFIDPAKHYKAQSFRGKVVLVTGASRGIGQEAALDFAKAGAHLVITARKQETLDETKKAILSVRPEAQVLTFVADVVDSARAQAAVEATVKQFGHLDVLVANAAMLRPMDKGFAEKDPNGWWNVFEVNLRGAYNYIHYAIPELVKTGGTIIATTSAAAQIRLPSASEYSISKFALNRFIEYVVLENPGVKAYAVHPGVVKTAMNIESGMDLPAQDSVELPAAVFLHLASGKAEYLNGRYVSVNWDLEEVESKWKDKIISGHELVAKLSIPA